MIISFPLTQKIRNFFREDISNLIVEYYKLDTNNKYIYILEIKDDEVDIKPDNGEWKQELNGIYLFIQGLNDGQIEVEIFCWDYIPDDINHRMLSKFLDL